ncbi:MAG: recombinase family protein [Lachnospiraceae bacterium]|nr:recombinase family protein [Lachnospiraceae bacterium]
MEYRGLETRGKELACDMKIWQAALYVRLSREDGDKSESDSIVNQKELLAEFVRLEPDIEIFDVYVDDGWSGTTFDRPEFRRMEEDILKKRVDCVIVKDLSRFGRNYIDSGHYFERVFPLLDVRFISITDNVDSYKNPQSMNNIMVPFKNLINDEYCRDISNKVRSSLDMKRKQGKHIGSFACYGYMKDPNDHNHLVPDPEAAEVVRDIFQWFVEGTSLIGLAKKLNAMHILNPTAYKEAKGFSYRHPQIKINDGLWSDGTLRRILTNRMYVGDMVQGVNKIKSYKVQVAQRQPEDKWIIVEGTHEPIVSRELFDKAQSIMSRRTRTTPGETTMNIFAGLMRCADCGKAMNRKQIKQSYGMYRYYVCSTFKKLDKGACTKHSVRLEKVEEAVLAAIQMQIQLAVDMKQAIDVINKSAAVNTQSGKLQKQLEQAKKEEANAEKLMLDLYPDWKAGMITAEEYQKLKAKFEAQREDARVRIRNINMQMAEVEKGQDSANEYIQNFMKFKNVDTLTRDLVVSLIDNIFVYEGGDIHIDFKFQSPFLMAKEFIENNASALSEEVKKKALLSA